MNTLESLEYHFKLLKSELNNELPAQELDYCYYHGLFTRIISLIDTEYRSK